MSTTPVPPVPPFGPGGDPNDPDTAHPDIVRPGENEPMTEPVPEPDTDPNEQLPRD